MKTGLAQDTTKSAKNLAQQIAKQMAREPLEILKTSREQITGEKLTPKEEQHKPQTEDQQKEINKANMLNDKLKSTRMVEALNYEISDIQKQDLFKDLQKRISEGEEIPIEDFAELSFEQRDVLKAQIEAVKMQMQMQNAKNSNAKFELFGPAKKGRRMGQKQAAQKEQTRVEKPVPPSG
ncbi:MAG: hypothetical protein AAB622_03370 [Patescibacteria group bacterium]